MTFRTLQAQILRVKREHDTGAIEWLLDLARFHENSLIRRSAIVALRDLKSNRVLPLLALIIESEKNENLRETAIKALGSLGDAETASVLRHIARSGDTARFGQQAASKALKRLEARLRVEPSRESSQDSVPHFHSCFISYATSDQPFADRLHVDLQKNGVRCWYAPHDIKGGRKIHEQVDDAIRLYDRLLLVLSEHSMASEWVKTEIAHARQKERNGSQQVLFPISLVPFSNIQKWKCFDADTGKDSAREIREYFIPDFTNWKDSNAYQYALERLLRDLKEP